MRNRLMAILITILSLFGVTPLWAQSPQPILQPVWQAYYFNNPYLLEPIVFQRQDTSIGFDWGGGSPGANIAADNFSVRWITDMSLAQGVYRFYAQADDEVRVLVDNNHVIDTFGNPRVGQIVVGDVTLDQGTHRIQVDYREFGGGASVFFSFESLADGAQGPLFVIPAAPPPAAPPTAQTTWTTEYFTNRDLAGNPTLTRQENSPTNNWGEGSPDPSIPVGNFSARWSRYVNFAGGVQRLRVIADDGVRVYIDNNLVLDEWHISTGETFTRNINLTAGIHLVRVEYFEMGGTALLDFSLSGIISDTPPPPSSPSTPTGATATINTGRLNVRSQPTASSDVLTRVSRGDVVPVLATNPEGTWIQITANGVTGWVSKRYVIVNNTSPAPAPTIAPSSPTGFSLVADRVTINIRNGPSSRFADIGNLRPNHQVQVVGRNAEATWWQINDNGLIGWVSWVYTRVDPAPDLTKIPITG